MYNRSAGTKRCFEFNQVFTEDDSNREIFERSFKEVVLGALDLDGHSVCLFAYGATGSGKTYTLAGQGVTTVTTIAPRDQMLCILSAQTR